jgi:hypothetical protein
MDELSIATAIGKELEPAVSEFAATVTGAPASELGGWLADKIRLRRYVSTIKALGRARQATIDAGLPPHAVPYKTLIPLRRAGEP